MGASSRCELHFHQVSPLTSPTLAHNQRRRCSPVPTVDGKGLLRSLPATACALSVEAVASWVVHPSYVPIPDPRWRGSRLQRSTGPSGKRAKRLSCSTGLVWERGYRGGPLAAGSLLQYGITPIDSAKTDVTMRFYVENQLYKWVPKNVLKNLIMSVTYVKFVKLPYKLSDETGGKITEQTCF
jgi:hypothetical protein